MSFFSTLENETNTNERCTSMNSGERDVAQRYSVRSWCDGDSDRSFMGWTH